MKQKLEQAVQPEYSLLLVKIASSPTVHSSEMDEENIRESSQSNGVCKLPQAAFVLLKLFDYSSRWLHSHGLTDLTKCEEPEHHNLFAGTSKVKSTTSFSQPANLLRLAKLP